MQMRIFKLGYCLVAQAVGSTLKEADLVVEAHDESGRDLVRGLAVGGNAAPMALDDPAEPMEGLKPLPAQRRAPVREELADPNGVSVREDLPGELLEQVSRTRCRCRVLLTPPELSPAPFGFEATDTPSAALDTRWSAPTCHKTDNPNRLLSVPS